MDLFDRTNTYNMYFEVEGREFYAKFSGADLRYDREKFIDFVDGRDIKIVYDDDFADEDIRRDLKDIIPDRITFVRKGDRSLHYNLAA